MTKLLLIATIAGERVAISASEVESVVELGSIVPVPRAAPHVAGLAALRSRVLTVVDCYAATGVRRPAGLSSNQAIVIEADGHPYALLVDDVEDAVEVSADIRPASGKLEPGLAQVTRGTIMVSNRLLLIVDPARLATAPALGPNEPAV